MTAPDMGSFEFVADGATWTGTPVVNGHKVLTCEHIDVSIGHDNLAQVTLRLLAGDGLKVVLGEARIAVADETREALISLGWTAPDGDGADLSLEAAREVIGEIIGPLVQALVTRGDISINTARAALGMKPFEFL